MANYHKTERGNVDCEMVLQLFKSSVEIKKNENNTVERKEAARGPR